MDNEAIQQKAAAQPDPRVQLAFERTFLAYERTRIAWVRTALSLISFGFVIAKFFQYLREKQGETATVLSPRGIGLVMITIGLVGVDSGELAGATGREGAARALPQFTGIRIGRGGGADRVVRRPGAHSCANPIITFEDRNSSDATRLPQASGYSSEVGEPNVGDYTKI